MPDFLNFLPHLRIKLVIVTAALIGIFIGHFNEFL